MSDIHSWHKWESIVFGGPGIVHCIEQQNTERNRPMQSRLEYEIWTELINEKVEVILQGQRREDQGTPVSWICSRFFFILPLSLITSKSCTIKLNWINLKSQPHLTSPCPPHTHTPELPWNGAREPLSVDLAGGCGVLPSVPLTSILSVKNSIPHCWKQQFAKQAGLESCLMKHPECKRESLNRFASLISWKITDQTCPLVKCFLFAL